MARPQKEGMDYFPHDTNASSDKKVEVLRLLYGNDGYAFYFIMLEQIYQEKDFELDISEAETREETYQILTKKISVTREKFEQMLDTAIKRSCFDKEAFELRGVITSLGIKKRASVVLKKREFMRDRYGKDKQEQGVISDAETISETREETPQRKEKKRKEKKSINTILKTQYADSVTLSDEEYTKLVTEHGQDDTTRMIEILSNYKLSSGKKYKSDYHAILNWVVKRLTEEKAKKSGQAMKSREKTDPSKYENFYL